MRGLTAKRLVEYNAALNDSEFLMRFFDKLPENFHEEFKDRTEPDDCGLWSEGLRHRGGGDTVRGVGVVKFNSKEDCIENCALDVHVLIWSIWNHRLPREGSRILRTCRNSSCINPNHLYEEVAMKLRFS